MDASGELGAALAVADVSRATATGDYDNDGDVDLLVTNEAGRPNLLRNDGGNGAHWLIVELIGSRHRDALGARVELAAGGIVQVRERQGGGSYLSASDPRLHFGLGSAEAVDLTVFWPDGSASELAAVKANQIVTVNQPPN